MISFFRFIFLIFGCSFIWSCNDKPQDEKHFIDKMSKKERTEMFQKSMKHAIEKEQKQLKSWTERYGENFIETPTGVHILVIEKGDTTRKINKGDKILVDYTLSLMNGDTISKTMNKPELIVVEFDHKESGLHEALKTLNINSEAIVLIPSYRAHGLIGDSEKIPALSSVIYQIKIVDVE